MFEVSQLILSCFRQFYWPTPSLYVGGLLPLNQISNKFLETVQFRRRSISNYLFTSCKPGHKFAAKRKVILDDAASWCLKYLSWLLLFKGHLLAPKSV